MVSQWGETALRHTILMISDLKNQLTRFAVRSHRLGGRSSECYNFSAGHSHLWEKLEEEREEQERLLSVRSLEIEMHLNI